MGQSLDCAIVDLSSSVFCAGMAVAISRVRRLDGLYLTLFDPTSIIVSNSSLEEVNRLRSGLRKDLPLYNIPPTKKGPIKCKIPLSDEICPPAKKPRRIPDPMKCKATLNDGKKSAAADAASSKDCEITAVSRPVIPLTEWTDYRLLPWSMSYGKDKHVVI